MSILSRILYVEDDPDIREVGILSLEAVGEFTVRPAASGQEALEAVESFIPDLVLIDVMMPGMDGPATLRALRERPAMKDIPAIFLTAKAQRQEVSSYIALGALGVITKPFDPMTLPDTIRRLWREQGGKATGTAG